jgi:hypothetical protein
MDTHDPYLRRAIDATAGKSLIVHKPSIGCDAISSRESCVVAYAAVHMADRTSWVSLRRSTWRTGRSRNRAGAHAGSRFLVLP